MDARLEELSRKGAACQPPSSQGAEDDGAGSPKRQRMLDDPAQMQAFRRIAYEMCDRILGRLEEHAPFWGGPGADEGAGAAEAARERQEHLAAELSRKRAEEEELQHKVSLIRLAEASPAESTPAKRESASMQKVIELLGEDGDVGGALESFDRLLKELKRKVSNSRAAGHPEGGAGKLRDNQERIEHLEAELARLSAHLGRLEAKRADVSRVEAQQAEHLSAAEKLLAGDEDHQEETRTFEERMQAMQRGVPACGLRFVRG